MYFDFLWSVFHSYFSPAYQPILSTIIANCETLYDSAVSEQENKDQAVVERTESISSPRKGSSESELIEDDPETKNTELKDEEDKENTEEDSSECAIS